MYCSSHDRDASTDVNLKRKRQNTEETKRKTKQLKLTDMFNNQDILDTPEDTDVDPTFDENANKTYDEFAVGTLPHRPTTIVQHRKVHNLISTQQLNTQQLNTQQYDFINALL